MSKKNPKVDHYFTDGCGRCPLGGTPGCKALQWRAIFDKLRPLLLSCGLAEELKWGVPCYTTQGRNVLLMAGFKDYCALSFFKGVLLTDPRGLLQRPGENTQAGRLVRLTRASEVDALAPQLTAFIHEAIAIEHAGRTVPLKPIHEHPVPPELQERLDADPALEAAFHALTPGRQRGYLLHIAAPKQSQTRARRTEQCAPRILAGKGLHD